MGSTGEIAGPPPANGAAGGGSESGLYCLLTRFLLRFPGALGAGSTINSIYLKRGNETEGFDITEGVRIRARGEDRLTLSVSTRV